VAACPIPKLPRRAPRGRFIQSIFDGETINTPSMLAVEDDLDGLRWAEYAGGLPGLIARTEQNMAIIEAWVERTSWVDFLAREPAQRSTTSVCLRIVDPAFSRATDAAQRRFVAQMTTSLAEAGTAFDIAGYRDAPPGLRIWCGATVEASDLRTLLPWLDWAFVGAAGSLAGSAAAA
jgi:phosphoserine aminotransferase